MLFYKCLEQSSAKELVHDNGQAKVARTRWREHAEEAKNCPRGTNLGGDSHDETAQTTSSLRSRYPKSKTRYRRQFYFPYFSRLLTLIAGLQSFKLLLDGILDGGEKRSDNLAILREFLESSQPMPVLAGGDDEGDDNATYLSEIMETWSFAAQAKNENVLSAVVVALALLLKVISPILDLRPFGLGICRTLLQKQQLELLAGNLSAEKGKEFIISPTLRLLREALCFDGGVLAKSYFRARSHTFRSLARNMGIKYLGDGIEDPKRPSARTAAVRFFLSALKFLHSEAKSELLSQRELAAALTKTIKDDPPYLIQEILDTVKSSVLMDRKLPRASRFRLLNATALTRISSLYGYNHEAPDGADQKPVDELAHDFLMLACASTMAGIARQESGFYPVGVDPDQISEHEPDESKGLSLDHIVWMDKFKDEVPVHNTTLAEFVQTLRPWSSTKQSELVVSIFAACPELVARYFANKRAFTFEPKLSATWTGYAALIFSTMQLDVPPYFGYKSKYARAPPPASILLDNIIPPPLTQKILSRCLSQKSKLISFSAVRLLVVAMEKLRRVLVLYEEASQANGRLWVESSRKLVDQFCQRCPSMKDLVSAYRATPEDDLLSREAASRALRLCFEVIPQAALSAKFDVAPVLISILQRVSNASASPQDQRLMMLELENLLAVAGYSPSMRWFSKADGLPLSPFTTLMRVSVETPGGATLNKLQDVLDFVAREHQLVTSGLVALLECLQSSPPPDGVWNFIDNCAIRCSNAPIKYLEMLQDTINEVRGTREIPCRQAETVSPIIMTMVEQLPFVAASGDDPTLDALAGFVPLFLGFCALIGEHPGILQAILGQLAPAFQERSGARAQLVLPKGLTLGRSTRGMSTRNQGEGAMANTSTNNSGDASPVDLETLRTTLDVPLAQAADNAALSRWASKSADDLVEDGHAAALIGLLASDHISIRKEALTNILKMAAKLRDSSYEERDQVWLLLSELAESARAQIQDGPLPSHIIAFAQHAVEVLKNPLHCLYAKVNTFLTSRPVWSLGKLPLVYDILQEGPTNDDSLYSEVNWLLQYLLDSLRSPADLGLFHKTRLFEKVLSLTGNPYMRQPLRLQVLRLIYRASSIEGGSTTLVTRFGIVSWLQAQALQRDKEDEGPIYRAMLRRIWDTCDQARVDVWSKHGTRSLIVDQTGIQAHPL